MSLSVIAGLMVLKMGVAGFSLMKLMFVNTCIQKTCGRKYFSNSYRLMDVEDELCVCNWL